MNQFVQKETVFHHVYNTLSNTMQAGLIQHTKILADIQEEEEKTQINTIETIIDYLINTYRPSINYGNIFKQLHLISLRENENPYLVYTRVITALRYAKETIELLNKDSTDQIETITKEAKQQLLIRIYCTKNCTNNNNGNINKLTAKRVQASKPKTLKDWYTLMKAISNDINSPFFNGNSDNKIKSYEPILLPLWEYIPIRNKNKITPHAVHHNKHDKRNNRNTNNNKLNKYGKRNRDKDNKDTKQPPFKRHKIDENTRWCFRCGRIGMHTPTECYAKFDINNKPIKSGELKYTPQKTNNRPPSKNTTQYTNTNNKQYTTNKYTTKSPSSKTTNQRPYKQYKTTLPPKPPTDTPSQQLNILKQILTLKQTINNSTIPMDNQLINSTNNVLKDLASDCVQNPRH